MYNVLVYNVLVHAGSVIKRLLLADSREIFLVEILEHLVLIALPDPLTHPSSSHVQWYEAAYHSTAEWAARE